MTSSSTVTGPSKAWERHTQGKEEQADRKKKKKRGLKNLEVQFLVQIIFKKHAQGESTRKYQ